MNKSLLPLALTAAVFAALHSSASAQSWTSIINGNWTDGTKWSTTPTAPANDGSAAINFNVNGNQTSTVDTPYSIASLTFGSASGGNITLATSALTIGSGGIKNNMTLTGGVTMNTPLTIGASQTWSTGDAVSYAVDRNINIFGAITGTADKTITVSGTQDDTRIRNYTVSFNNNATSAGNWVVDGGRRLALGTTGTHSFGTGTITVNAGGKLGGSGGSSFITNNVTLAGGTLRTLSALNGGNFAGNLAITANSFVEIPLGTVINSGNLGINNSPTSTITGSGNLTVNAVGTGTLFNALTIGNAAGVAATNTGTLTLNANTRAILNKGNNTAAWGGNIIVNDGGTLAYRTDAFRYNQVADTATVTINGAGTWNMNASAGNQTRERITALVVNGSTPFTDGATASRIFLGGSGVVGSAANGTGADAAGTAGLFVTTGGTLSGGGTVNKATTILGGVLAVGDNSIGKLTFSQSLTLVTGLAANSLQYELGASTTAGVTYGNITLGTGINLNIGASLLNFSNFQFTNMTGFGAGTYSLFDTDNTITGSLGSSLTGTINGMDASIGVDATNQDIILTVTAVPEPSTWLGGGLILGLAVWSQRKRFAA